MERTDQQSQHLSFENVAVRSDTYEWMAQAAMQPVSWMCALSASLELVRSARLVIDFNATLIAANSRARQVLENAAPLRVEGRHVRASETRDALALRTALSTLKKGALTETLSVVLGRSELVHPLHVRLERLFDGMTLDNSDTNAFVQLSITTTDATVTLNRQTLTMMFELTAREVDVAELLADGMTLAEIARVMEISRETVRTHIKRLFAKTDTNSQAGLMRLLLISAL